MPWQPGNAQDDSRGGPAARRAAVPHGRRNRALDSVHAGFVERRAALLLRIRAAPRLRRILRDLGAALAAETAFSTGKDKVCGSAESGLS